jgi:copper chaperone CopZ
MEAKTFVVPNIGCDGCVRTVENEVKDIAGVQSVSGDVDSKQVTVQWDTPASWDQIKSTLTEIDYAPQEA